MREIVADDAPIMRERVPREEAIALSTSRAGNPTRRACWRTGTGTR